MVDTWLLSLESAAEGVGPVDVRPGLQAEDGPEATPPAAAMRDSSSSVSPCVARGAGSTPRRVKRSASEAKQRRAPSDTCEDRQGKTEKQRKKKMKETKKESERERQRQGGREAKQTHRINVKLHSFALSVVRVSLFFHHYANSKLTLKCLGPLLYSLKRLL